MKKIFILSFTLSLLLGLKASAQSITLQPNTGGNGNLLIKSTGYTYGNISTTQPGGADLFFRAAEPGAGAGGGGTVIGNISTFSDHMTINTAADKYLNFATNGIQAMRVDASNQNMFINNKLGINISTPNERLTVYQTGDAGIGWGAYVSGAAKIAIGGNGSHATVGDNFDAIGVAGYGGNASNTKNNIGVMGSVGNSGANNVGVWGYLNGNYAGNAYGMLGEAVQNQDGGGATVGVYGKAYGVGNAYKYAVRAYAADASTTGSQNIYGVYSTATSSNSSTSNSIYTYGTFSQATGSVPRSYGVSAYASNSFAGINYNYGVYSSTYGSNANSTSYGVYGYAGGVGALYGVYGEIPTGVSGYAVYGKATTSGISTGYAGYFLGDIYWSGTNWSSSDEKLKQNIQVVNGALDKVMKLNPSTYEFRTTEYSDLNLSSGTHYGFTAQGVQKVLPELVKETTAITQPAAVNNADPDNKSAKETTATNKTTKFLTVNYTEIIPVLTKAIQEQQTIIEDLKARIVVLEGKVK